MKEHFCKRKQLQCSNNAHKWFQPYHRFRWYVTLENKTPAETFPKFPSVLHVIDTDQIEIHQSQPLVWPSDLLYVMLAGCDWWIFIWSVDNMYDWRKFRKRFRGCFVFESRVSRKTVVNTWTLYIHSCSARFDCIQMMLFLNTWLFGLRKQSLQADRVCPSGTVHRLSILSTHCNRSCSFSKE